jgi:hypothetical protein
METGARVVLGGFVTIILLHYLNGGRDDVARWLKYVFTGRGTGNSTALPDGPDGKPRQKLKQANPDGSITESEIGVP